jgi:hypothetical protein
MQEKTLKGTAKLEVIDKTSNTGIKGFEKTTRIDLQIRSQVTFNTFKK